MDDRHRVDVLDEHRAALSVLATSARFVARLDDVPEGARAALALIEVWSAGRLSRAVAEQAALLQAEAQG